jgi:two-component system sensor histidine kinase KdpD
MPVVAAEPPVTAVVPAPPPGSPLSRILPTARAAGIVAALLGVATGAVALVESEIGGELDGAPLYLVAVVVVATRYRTAAGIATALGSFALYNLLFTEPRFTLIVADAREWLNLVLFLFVAVAIGRLAGVGANRTAEAEARAKESAALYAITRTLATTSVDGALPSIVQRLVTETGMDRVWCTVDAGGRERVVADSGTGDPGPAPSLVRTLTPGGGDPTWMRMHAAHPPSGRATPERRREAATWYRVRLDADGHPVGALWATRAADRPEPSQVETRLLALTADQLGLAIGRERLREQAVAAEVARRDDALKSALVDSVSHDLRTPLAGIRAAAGTLADPDALRSPEDVRRTATTIEVETQRLDRLVGGLLDLSRIQAGSIRPNLEALDVEGVVRPVLERLAPLLGERRVEVDIPADLPPIAGDAVFVDQSLANLVENVARHTPAGTALAIRARPDAQPGMLELVVEDEGPGVDPDVARHLFDRFYRAGGPSRAGAGMGIGLTIVRGLTEAMGGTVEAGRGSRGGLAVRLRLPAMTPPGDEPEP